MLLSHPRIEFRKSVSRVGREESVLRWVLKISEGLVLRERTGRRVCGLHELLLRCHPELQRSG